MELRDYQQKCVSVIDNMQSGSGLVSMATGLGKTVVFSRIKRKGRILILSHREELVRQPIKYYDCPCGVEQGESISHGEDVISASVQSLVRRLDRFPSDYFDTIITDEAHHAAAPSYRKIYEHFSPRLHIGFTATPSRGDKVRLDGIYDDIIFQRDLKWGIKAGWLTDVRCLRVKISYNVSAVKRRLGDFVVKDLDKAVNISKANKEVAEVYKRYARGQTLIFAASVAHAKNIAVEIDGAVVVSAETENRSQIISDFTARKIPCIVNCMVFTEGTDMPLIETIIIARPTQNASLYTQMVGRGLRRSEGKSYLTLIDCVGISGKLDICTAPTLMGLDLTEVPEARKQMVEGMLTDMPSIIEDAADCAENWVMNAEAVRLFASEQGVDIRKINWTKKSNGDLVYQFRCGDRIGVKAIDELGRTRLMCLCYSEAEKKFVYTESELLTLQEALDRAYARFFAAYRDEEKFWNLSEYYSWQFEPATEKQREFIRNSLPKEEWEALESTRRLTKGDAAQILNALSVRRVTLKQMEAMHRRTQEQKQAESERLKKLSSLKIRYVLNKDVRFPKYYAVALPDDLVITNEWTTASLMIEEAGKENCRFKKFTTKEQAVAFLREGK